MSKKKRAKTNRKFPVLIVFLLIILVAAAGILGEVITRRLPSHEKADLQALYGAEEGYASVLANHQWMEVPALWVLDHGYLAYEVIRDELNGRFYWDPAEEKLLYTLPEEIIAMDSEMADDGAPVVLQQDDTVYVSLSFVQKYSNISVEYFSGPDRVVLQTEWGTETLGTLSKETDVRVKGGVRSPIITTLAAGEQVTILTEMENWSQVQTPDGWIGYLPNRNIGEKQEVEQTGPYTEPEFTGCPVDYKVCMAWQQTINNSGFEAFEKFLAKDTPVTTIAPTWFSLISNEGEISSLASRKYVKAAHKAGLDVWAVLENVNAGGLDMTEMLVPTSHRNALVEQVMAELDDCGADGLNLDFESIPQAAGDGYIQLVRELSVACRKRGLVFSVNDYVPSSWTAHYNREEQGIVADYVVVMAYDEHYSGSDPGSVASLPFVSQGISDTVAAVPAEKVICGMPFYTRMWTDAPGSLTSEALGMTQAAEFVSNHGGKTEWLEDIGQNYARIQEGETVYQIWLEDADSARARLQMSTAFDLAGVAFWKLGMQNDSIWPVIQEFFDT